MVMFTTPTALLMGKSTYMVNLGITCKYLPRYALCIVDDSIKKAHIVSGRYYSKFYLYHLVSKDIRSSYNNSVPISG